MLIDFCARTKGSYMVLHALTFAGPRKSCLNTRPIGGVFKLLPRDPANIDALKPQCMVVILAFYMSPKTPVEDV